MECPSCKSHVDDHAHFCAHCGQELEHKFCAQCGGQVGAANTKAPGTIFVLIVMAAIIGIILSQRGLSSGNTIQPLTNVPTDTEPVVLRPYDVIETNTIEFLGVKTTEYKISMKNGESNRSVIQQVALQLINEKKAVQPGDAVDVYVYLGDAFQRDPAGWVGKFTYLNTDLNPSYDPELITGESIEDHVYVVWH